MNKTLLDTEILSEILKGRDPSVVAVAARYLGEHQQLTFSAVTVFEIIRGSIAARARTFISTLEKRMHPPEYRSRTLQR